MRIALIYDSDHPGARQNKCFTEEYANEGPGHSFTVEMARQARQLGYDIMTADVFLSRDSGEFNNTKVYCITDMHSKQTNALLRRGVIPFLCLSFESPIIARDFYINIKKLAGQFIYAMQFRGTKVKLDQTSTTFLTMYFPVDNRSSLPVNNWKEKKMLVLINRNKRIFYSDYSSFKGVLKSVLSPIKLALQKSIDPWIRSKEIYRDRIEAINYFSGSAGFELYGRGWDERIPGFPRSYQSAAQKVYKGGIEPDKKLVVMNQFKFSICFENCVFPGYITEKIFDCFLAGCIPVYFGAPDIKDFVPANTFIDYRDFPDFDSLERHLNNLPEAMAIEMLESAKSFLQSQEFDRHYHSLIIGDIFSKIRAHHLTH